MRLGALRKLQRHLSYATPLCVLLFGGLHAWLAGFSANVMLAVGTLLFFATFLGISLYKRSRGQETKFFTVRALVDADESLDDPVEFLSLDFLFALISVVFVAVAALLPYLASSLR
jgi:hypothetical protein